MRSLTVLFLLLPVAAQAQLAQDVRGNIDSVEQRIEAARQELGRAEMQPARDQAEAALSDIRQRLEEVAQADLGPAMQAHIDSALAQLASASARTSE